MGKGCLRSRRPETIDHDLARDLLHTTAAKPGTISCELTGPCRELLAPGRDRGLRDISQVLQEPLADGLSAIQVIRSLSCKRTS